MSSHDTTILTDRTVSKLKPPQLYNVILLNDDYTPMDFVVYVLMKFFNKSSEVAEQLMLQVHFSGSAICGKYPKDIAATKVNQVNSFSQSNEHPLNCIMEEE